MTWLLAGLSLGATTGCGPDGPKVIHGTGPVIRQQREYRPADTIKVEGYTDLVIEVLPLGPGALPEDSGGPTVVYLEGAADLLDWVETDLSGDTLSISFRDGVRLDPLPSIEVHTSYLVELESLGSGEVRLSGLSPSSTHGEPLGLQFMGSADLQAEGTVGELRVEQIGSGDLDLRGLQCASTHYSGLGSGDVWVHVTESLSASLKGSGDLYLHGTVPDERVETSVLGGGKIIRVRE